MKIWLQLSSGKQDFFHKIIHSLLLLELSFFCHLITLSDESRNGVGADAGLPGPIWQLSIKGGAPWDSCLVLLENLLALQAVRALRGRASG